MLNPNFSDDALADRILNIVFADYSREIGSVIILDDEFTVSHSWRE